MKMSGTIIRKGAGRLMSLMGLVVLMTAWLSPTYCLGDEIGLKDKGAQKSDTQLILEKLEQLEKRIERLEKKQAEPKQTGLSPIPLPRPEIMQEESKGTGSSSPTPPKSAKKGDLHEQLLQEELGSVQGVILWQGKPLVNGKVKIELENYTGVSLASVKKMLSRDDKESYETDQGISLNTQTDAKGRYVFEKVPPGTYRLYWWPDFKTGWVHRLREKPDFEVITGKLTSRIYQRSRVF